MEIAAPAVKHSFMNQRYRKAMDSSPLSSELTLAEQRMLAAQYRQMAEIATVPDVREAMLRLARRYEEMASQQAARLRDALNLQ